MGMGGPDMDMGGCGMGTAGPGFGRGMGPRVGMGRGGMMGGMGDGGMGFGGGYGPMGNEGPGFGNFKDQIEMGGDMMGGGAMGQGGGLMKRFLLSMMMSRLVASTSPIGRRFLSTARYMISAWSPQNQMMKTLVVQMTSPNPSASRGVRRTARARSWR